MFSITFKQYVIISFGLLTGLFVHLLNVYDYNFFHIIMHITVTKASTIVITNAGFIIMFYCGKLILSIFVGRLRDIEIEEIIDQGRVFLLDTIFFLLFSSPTINNVEVGAMVLSRYITFILLLKMLHLITHIRINHMFEVEKPKTFNIIRIALLLNIMMIIDLTLIFRYLVLLSRESTLRLWVFFESISLFVSCVISIGKYTVHIIDLKIQALQSTMKKLEEDSTSEVHGDSPTSSYNFVWSSKNAILFYMEVIGDICSLIAYLLFIILFLLLNPSRIPLYIMGDIFHIIKALYSKLSSFRRYRKLTKNMESKFQEATLEEIEKVDTCIVCRDTLYIGSKKIPCGHVFHLDCLKSWFIQQQTCPICRSPISIQNDIKENISDVRAERVDENFVNISGGSNNAVQADNPISSDGLHLNYNVNNVESNDCINSGNENNCDTQDSHEINIKKIGVIIKSLIISETQDTSSVSNSDNNGSNIKKYRVSTHKLLKRNQHYSIPENTSSNKNFHYCTHSLSNQIPPVKLHYSHEMRRETLDDFHNTNDTGFDPALCELYRRNADLWLNKINNLIDYQPHSGNTDTNCNMYINKKGSKNNFRKRSSPLEEIIEKNHEAKNSLDNLLNSVNKLNRIN